MDRRRFLLTSLAGALAAPLAAGAQQAGKVWRIGCLCPPRSAPNSSLIQAFEQGLRELGYVDGQNIILEYRSENGEDEQLPRLAAELVRLRVDVLVASLPQRVAAAKKATTTIPIVMVNVGDPVEIGLVASLARPGGNVTGLSRLSGELIGKNLSLLKEALPRTVRVGALLNPTTPLSPVLARNAKRAAESLGLPLTIVEAKRPDDLEGAFSALATDRVEALLVLADGMFWGERKRIADLALRRRLPSMFSNIEYATAGGLMAYAPSSADPYRRAAVFVDKILKGAKPGDLPVEQPTKFELVINLKTAKALGLTIPPSLLLRADQVIE
jgi:putative ABC transport system substrate-binding protein